MHRKPPGIGDQAGNEFVPALSGFNRLTMDGSNGINEIMLRRDVEIDGECPDIIVADVARRPRADAHIIVVANEKGGAGKSTIAFHICIALAKPDMQ